MSRTRFRSMGCEVVVDGADAAAVEALFHDYDRRFTRFRRDSELARVNRAAGPVLVSEPFARALRAALRARELTDGLVEPALLDALEAAGYDRDFGELAPDMAPPAPPRGQDGFTLTGRLLTTRARLDLNGVVKSLAIDDALCLLGGGWVAAGGDVATARPLEVALPRGGSVRLERGALATSGTTKRRWVQRGAERHHLIDPRTRRPSESPWREVTVCGATCLDADIAAKAAFLLGDDGPAWLDERGLPGRFVRAGGAVEANGSWTTACT